MQKATYHGTMELAVKSAINRIMREKVKGGEVETLQEFLNEYQRVSGEVADATRRSKE